MKSLILMKAVSSFCQSHYVKSKHHRPSPDWFSQVTKILLLGQVRFIYLFILIIGTDNWAFPSRYLLHDSSPSHCHNFFLLRIALCPLYDYVNHPPTQIYPCVSSFQISHLIPAPSKISSRENDSKVKS